MRKFLPGKGGLRPGARRKPASAVPFEPERMPVSHRIHVVLRTLCLAGIAFAPSAAIAQDTSLSLLPSGPLAPESLLAAPAPVQPEAPVAMPAPAAAAPAAPAPASP